MIFRFMYYLGFDIGGSSVKAVLVKNKEIVKSVLSDLPDNLSGLLSLIGQMKDELTADVASERIGGIGFAVAGAIDKEQERILKAPNISYLDGQPLKRIFEEKFTPCAVKMDNDARCFLLAEKKTGAAKNLENIFYLILGTGIGGAWTLDGKIIRGAHGAAGEAGHTIIDIASGNDFEALASNKFIKKESGVESSALYQKARSGDKNARDIFTKLGRNLGVGIANVINIIDPEAIIISGGVAQAQESILPGIKESVEKFVISPAAKQTPILFSALGRFGGALGAALLFG